MRDAPEIIDPAILLPTPLDGVERHAPEALPPLDPAVSRIVSLPAFPEAVDRHEPEALTFPEAVDRHEPEALTFPEAVDRHEPEALVVEQGERHVVAALPETVQAQLTVVAALPETVASSAYEAKAAVSPEPLGLPAAVELPPVLSAERYTPSKNSVPPAPPFSRESGSLTINMRDGLLRATPWEYP